MMKKAREFDDILDECLERVLVGGETVDQCLAEYPEQAAELEPLLRTSLVSQEALAIKPRPEFRERASYQFQAAIRETVAQKSRGFFGWQPRWVTAVVVVVVILLAGSGTVVAAGNSLPDGPLYQVKLATESARLMLTPSALGKAELYVELADKRVAEIIEMADRGKAAQVERTTQRLNTHLLAMASLEVPGMGGVIEEQPAAFEAEPPPVVVAEAPRAQVSEVAPTPAPAPVPAPVPEAPPAEVKEAPATVMEPAPLIAVPEAPGLTEDAEGVEPDESAELRRTLSRRAAENSEALRAVLERVPESVKPALRRAIEVADAGYEQALSNLD